MGDKVVILSANSWARDGKSGVSITYIPESAPMTGNTVGHAVMDGSLTVENAAGLSVVPGLYSIGYRVAAVKDSYGKVSQALKPEKVLQCYGAVDIFAVKPGKTA